MSSQPPKYWLRFFSWYCNPEYAEDIEGDLLERFEKRKELGAPAKWLFITDVLRLFRPGIIRNFNKTQKLSNMAMIKNDLKTSLRLIRKEKLYSGINILGLTAGFVIALLILFYVKFELSYEQYNPNADHMVRITMDYLDGEDLVDQDCETYHILGPLIDGEFPEVQDFTRAFGVDDIQLRIEDKYLRGLKIYAVDQSFLKLFNYPLIQGDGRTALASPNEIVLTESAAIKYFGTKDILGKTIIGRESYPPLKVVGVTRDSPANTHLKFEMLISYSTMKPELDERNDIWDSNDTYTYLQLSSPDQYPVFKENLAKLTDRLRKKDFIPRERIVSEKISDIHLYSDKSYEAEPNGEATIVFFLFGVALMVIVIAVVNYINLSTAKSLDRAKEVGIRKVIGSSMFQLRMRFFTESLLMNFIAGLATLIVIAVVWDWFKALTGLVLPYEIYESTFFWYLFLSLVTISTLLSGSFPAFVLSSFQPVTVLKGKFTHSSRGVFLRKSLVVFQFSIAIFLLIQTFTATEQLTYMQQKDLGMTTDRVLVVRAPHNKQINNLGPFKTDLLSQIDFKSVSLSSSVPGQSTGDMSSTTNINLKDAIEQRSNNFFIYRIDSNFIPTLEMELIAGENFSQANDIEVPVIVNEEALVQWGVTNPEEVIGKQSRFWGRDNTIVGVVKNFHQISVKSSHLPMIFLHTLKYGDYLSVRLNSGNILDQVDKLEETYTRHFPNSQFDFFFLDQNFDAQYRSDLQFQQVFTILSSFAILITCLGLFGLASFTVAKRAKEIGIRKVLGASVSQIIALLSTDFLLLVIISSIVAFPITYFLVEQWLNQYAYRIDINFWLFAIPMAIVLIVAFATVFSRTFKISNANPVQSLRDE